MSTKPGKLFIVATPIGNLADLSPRAQAVLGQVAVVAAEDTRHSGQLLQHFGITTPMTPLHDFNEREAGPALVDRLQRGEDVALISDAGTPLVSDPGHRLVDMAHEAGVEVVPVPGPCAVIAALSACGLPVERFAFEGFLPERGKARRERLQQLAGESRTLVFLEAPHRIEAALDDLVAIFGPGRRATLARELTKRFETVRRDDLGGLRSLLAADPDQRRGEFVLVVSGAPAQAQVADGAEARRVLALLLEKLSLKDAVAMAAGITGRHRNELYEIGLALRGESGAEH